jgi:nucleotide-binding universal stress UspA family protein
MRSAMRCCSPGTRARRRAAPRRAPCRFSETLRGSSSCRSATGPSAPSAHELARALAWHGIGAEARHIEQGSRRVRDILLAEAAAMAADLLVIGAYSRSRMRQVVFGGVTEHMLDHAEIPVLMAT